MQSLLLVLVTWVIMKRQMKKQMKKQPLFIKVIFLLIVICLSAGLSIYYFAYSAHWQLKELVVLPVTQLVSPELVLDNPSLTILANHPRLGVQTSLAPLINTVVSKVYQDLPAGTTDDLVLTGSRAEVLQALANGRVQAVVISEPEPAELNSFFRKKLQMKLIAKDARLFLTGQTSKIDNLSLRQAVNSKNANTWQAYQSLSDQDRSNYRLLSVAGIIANEDNIRRDVYPLVDNIYFAFSDTENVYLTRLTDYFLSVQGQKLLTDYHLVSLNH